MVGRKKVNHRESWEPLLYFTAATIGVRLKNKIGLEPLLQSFLSIIDEKTPETNNTNCSVFEQKWFCNF
jgi:hypothetical protein